MKHSYLSAGVISLVGLLALSGCNAVDRDVARAGGQVRASYDETRYRIANYIYSQEEPEHIPDMPPSSFCYQLLMDIVCYDRPRPDLHLKLVAVQGENAYRYEDYLPQSAMDSLAAHQAGQPYNSTGVVSFSSASGTARSSSSVNASGAGGFTTGYGDIKVSDLNHSGKVKETPFYHSPSPSTVDPFGKPKEPMTVLETMSERTKLVPLKLME